MVHVAGAWYRRPLSLEPWPVAIFFVLKTAMFLGRKVAVYLHTTG